MNPTSRRAWAKHMRNKRLSIDGVARASGQSWELTYGRFTFPSGQPGRSTLSRYRLISGAGESGRESFSLSTTPPTTRCDDINQEQFDRLLGWLDTDREQAGLKYESIRKRLIKKFASRGSNMPEELTDRTINRVARKLPEIQSSYVGDPSHYFCGVASNIFRESLRDERIPILGIPAPTRADEDDEQDYACLEKCLHKLSESERHLVLAYYQEEKQAKIEHRKKLAEQLGINRNALSIKACRIRAALEQWVELCRKDSIQSTNVTGRAGGG